MKNDIKNFRLRKIDRFYLFCMLVIVSATLIHINDVEAFYGSSNNFIYSTEYNINLESINEIDYLSVYDCSYDIYGSNNYIYCLDYYREKIYTIDGVYSNGQFKYGFNFITDNGQYDIFTTQNYVFTLDSTSGINYIYQYSKDLFLWDYNNIPDSWGDIASSQNHFFVVDNFYGSSTSTIRKIDEDIDFWNINDSIIDSYNVTSCVSSFNNEEIFYNHNLGNVILFKFCDDSTAEIHFLDSDLNYLKNKTALDNDLINIVFYEVNNSNYFLVYDYKIEKYNNNILGNSLYGDIFNVGTKTRYYNYSENKFYTCDINLSCSSFCQPLSYLTSESHYAILPSFIGDKTIFSSKIIDSDTCTMSEINSPISIPDIMIETDTEDYYFLYEKKYEIQSIYMQTIVTTTTTTSTSTSTSTLTSTSTSTSSTSSSSTSSTSSTTSLISNEDMEKINNSYADAYSIVNKTNEAITSGVDSLLTSQGVEYNEVSFGKSQQKEESQNIILLFMDFFLLLLIIILFYSFMIVIKQKRGRYY